MSELTSEELIMDDYMIKLMSLINDANTLMRGFGITDERYRINGDRRLAYVVALGHYLAIRAGKAVATDTEAIWIASPVLEKFER
jgi:hypothetical protein